MYDRVGLAMEVGVGEGLMWGGVVYKSYLPTHPPTHLPTYLVPIYQLTYLPTLSSIDSSYISLSCFHLPGKSASLWVRNQ